MKILILTHNKEDYTTQRLIQAGEQRYCRIEPINPTECFLDLNRGIFYQAQPLPFIQTIIPHLNNQLLDYSLSILRQMETKGIKSLNPSNAIEKTANHLITLQTLKKYNIAIPKTVLAHPQLDSAEILHFVNIPVIIKLLNNSKETGVILADNHKTAISIIDTLKSLNAYFLLQEYIPQPDNIQCLVIHNQVVAAAGHKNKLGKLKDEHYTAGYSIQLTKEQEQLAIKATQVLGLNVAMIKLIHSKQGSLVLEVNSYFDLGGVEFINQIDVAGAIIEYLIKKIR